MDDVETANECTKRCKEAVPEPLPSREPDAGDAPQPHAAVGRCAGGLAEHRDLVSSLGEPRVELFTVP